jgi:hypothetical protein
LASNKQIIPKKHTNTDWNTHFDDGHNTAKREVTSLDSALETLEFEIEDADSFFTTPCGVDQTFRAALETDAICQERSFGQTRSGPNLAFSDAMSRAGSSTSTYSSPLKSKRVKPTNFIGTCFFGTLRAQLAATSLGWPLFLYHAWDKIASDPTTCCNAQVGNH